MTKILAIANQKGGVGKTTVCLQLIHYLCEQGKKVLAIDLDGQGNLSSRLAESITDEDGNSTMNFGPGATRVYELFSEPENEKPIITTKCPNGAELIHTTLNDPELFDQSNRDFSAVVHPKKHLEKISNQYDYVIIDCPPSLGQSLIAALIMSTHVLTVVKVSGFAVDGASGLMNTIAQVQSSVNRNLKNIGLLINMYDKSPTHKRSLVTLKESLGNHILDNIIPYRTPLDTATSDGIPVWSLPYAHVTAKEMLASIKEILERIS